MYLVYIPRVKDQGRTKERPKNSETEKMLFIKIAVSFTSLIPSLVLPTDEREKTERTPTQLPAHKKCFFLRLLPKKVVPLPKKVYSYPKTIDYFPEKFVLFPQIVSFLCLLIPNRIRALHAFNL